MKLGRAAVLTVTLVGCNVVFEQTDWWPPPDMPDMGNGKILITNSASDTMSWIDVDSLDVVFTQPVGRIAAEREGPHHGAALSDGSAFFIGISNVLPGGAGGGPHGNHGLGTVPGYLLKYDPATGELLGEVRVDRSPGDVRLTPDGHTVLQSHFDLLLIQEIAADPEWDGDVRDMDSTLVFVNADTMVPLTAADHVKVCPAAHGIAVANDGARAWVACWASDELAEVDLATRTVTRHAVTGTPSDPTNPQIQPYAVAVNPTDDDIVFVSNIGNLGELRVYTPSTQTFSAPIVTGSKPFFGDFTSNGTRFYVANQGAPSSVTVHDGTTGAVLQTMILNNDDCAAPHAVFVLPGDQKALVVCEGNHTAPGTVLVLNIALPGDLPGVDDVLEVGVFPDDAFLLAP